MKLIHLVKEIIIENSIKSVNVCAMKYSLVQDKLSQMSVSKSNTIKQRPNV